MKNIFKKVFFIAVLIMKLASASEVEAATRVADHSATLMPPESKNVAISKDLALKREVIRRVLERSGSPMTEATNAFVDACIKYKFNCYLLPSIAWLESSLGRHLSAPYNAYGWGPTIPFASWADGMDKVGYGLRTRYITDGEMDPYIVGPKYASSPTWAVRVAGFISQFEAEEKSMSLYIRAFDI